MPSAKKAQFRPLSFMQAAGFRWVNPKAIVIVVGAVGTFTSPGENTLRQGLILVGISFVTSLFTMGAWLGCWKARFCALSAYFQCCNGALSGEFYCAYSGSRSCMILDLTHPSG